MHEALLYTKLHDSAVQCRTCQWHCTINPGKTGVCRMYRNEGGILYNLNYGLVSSVAADPIEKKPLFHFYPGTQVFSLGSWGCNFHCQGCQNWEISMVGKTESHSQIIEPRDAIEMAKRFECRGIAWTYNEPSIWFEYTLDCAKLAKQAGLYTVYVTNGYLSLEALDTIGPYLDAWRVDVKGFSDTLYRSLARVTNWRGILDVTQRAKKKWNMHVEVVTNIIPTMNDDDEQLEGTARWIHDELGDVTPWHVTRFHPSYQILNLPVTPVATLEHAYEIGRKAGLKFVYLGNVPGHISETTICCNCGKPIIKRFAYQTQIVGLNDSCCKFCGFDLNFRVR